MSGATRLHAKKLRIMKGIRTDIKTKWKNYVIKEDAEKARYHKVIRGKDNLIETIRATGLKKGAAYTFSARVRLRIQETTCRKVLELTCLDTWHTIGEEMAIAGKGDMDVFLTSAFTPPRFCGRKLSLEYRRFLHETRTSLCSARWGLLHPGACDGERGKKAASIHRPGIGSAPSEERRAA